MGETGKRNRRNDSENKNSRRRTDRDNDGNDELVVYRILCPGNVIGSVIGKSGKVINSIRNDTMAKVKVVDPFPGAKDRVITIYCYVKEKEDVEIEDGFDECRPLCPAQDALFRVHEAIANAVALVRNSENRNRDSDNRNRDRDSDNRNRDDMEECLLLVPSSQAASIIGKSGSTIKKIRKRARTDIKIEPKNINDPTHSCALDFDNFVLISGESDGVKKALFGVSTIMYKFGAKEGIPLDTVVPEALPIILPPDVPVYPATELYKPFDPILPSRSVPSVVSAGHLSDFQGYGEALPVYSSALPILSGYGSESRAEQLTVRVLCPSNKIGRVIGKGGSAIKSIRQTSGAKVEADDAKSDSDYCIVTVISTESSDDMKSMATEAVLMLQSKINDEDEDTVTMNLLVPKNSIGCIIGKSGAIIKEIRQRSNATVLISKGQKPKCAGSSDEHIEIIGEVSSVRDALIQIVLRLRDDVLEDKKKGGDYKLSAASDPIYNGGGSSGARSMASVLPNNTPSAYDPRAETGSRVDLHSSSNRYGYGSPPLEETGYNSFSSYSSRYYGGLSAPSALEMVIPGHAVVKVLGKGGMNLENIRKISGAVVDILESKSSRGDRLALISGTSEEKRAAENLIKAFIMST